MKQVREFRVQHLFQAKKRRRKGETMGHLFKCNSCKVMNIPASEIPDDKSCPLCKMSSVVEQCPMDHRCTCSVGIHSGVHFCKTCGNAICPGCGSHDVAAISRITGYLQDVGGWNAGKAQELKDRRHYDTATTGENASRSPRPMQKAT